MSSSRAKDSVPGGQRRSYISTQTFAGLFYTYRTEVQDLDIVGIWGQVTDISGQCPKGRILRENGRKLYPGANPNVNAYFVGVYDSVTFLSGFINPNESVFTVFNSDKPVHLADNHYAFDGVSEDGSEADEYDLGAPVYTKGNIETVDGDIIANAPGFGPHFQDHVISLQDLSGAAAYFEFDGPGCPYVEVQTHDYRAYGYIEACQKTTNMDLHGEDISGNENTVSIVAGSGEASIEATAYDISGNENSIGIYASDGSIWNSGLIYPYNARGTLAINGTGHGSTINQLLVQSNFVILTRVDYSGTAGHLSYDVINDSTLVVHSTENEESNINYLILGSAP